MRARNSVPSIAVGVVSFVLAMSLPFLDRHESYARVEWAPQQLSDGGAVPVQAGYFDKLSISLRANGSSVSDQSGPLVDFGSWVLIAEGEYLRAENESTAVTSQGTVFGPFLCPTPCEIEVQASNGSSTIYWHHNAEATGTTAVENWTPRVQSFMAYPMTIERKVQVVGLTNTTSYADSTMRRSVIGLIVFGLFISLVGLTRASAGHAKR